jgi:hypothetical protein
LKPSKKTLLDAAQIIEEMAKVTFALRIEGKAGLDVVDKATRDAKVAFDHMNGIAKELREGAA